MNTLIIPLNQRLSFRDKARLNVCIARDLADNFGGNPADYLRPLNRKLKKEIYSHFHELKGKVAVAA